MQISAKVIADSVIAEYGHRLTTLELCYPRFIHGEVMTHRVFSRNAMSSRAIPVAKMIDQVRKDPVLPLHWGTNQPGMQAGAELEGVDRQRAIDEWLHAAQSAARHAENLNNLGLHKQVANRLLEPFQWMRTIVSCSDWDNFFELRDHPDAEPHFQLLARCIRQAHEGSCPTRRSGHWSNTDSWHLPYVSEADRKVLPLPTLLRISAARCARVSYLTHDGQQPEIEKDIALFERLAGSRPVHASPLEHQACPHDPLAVRLGNLIGWDQFRHLVHHF